MDIFSIREQMKTKAVYDVSMRVTFYARVSSEKDEQLNSLDNQISYYKNFIQSNKNWTYVEGYIDEGISGISTEKRESFNSMIADAKEDKFDFIITKEISRFARNTLDSIRFTRDLLNMGVGVLFQNDNINTLDEDSELRLAIMSSIAQDELRKLSSRVKFGHAQSIKKSAVLGNSRIFGYEKDNKKLVINEEEAKMVRELFTLYATDEYSMKQIESIFWNKGYRNHNGNKIAHTTMSNIISNPKYKGYYCGNKVKVVDMFTKKQKFLPPEEWVMFKDETGSIVPAIVSEELWDKANAILKRRSDDVKSRQGKCNHPNLLTGKMYCMHCGKPYYRRESTDKTGSVNSKWICSGKINNGAKSCPSCVIYENEMKEILFQVFQETSDDADELIETYIHLYKKLEEEDTVAKELVTLEHKIAEIDKKKEKLLDHNLNGRIDDEDFAKMMKDLKATQIDLKDKLIALTEQQNSREEFKKHIQTMRTVLNQARQDASQNMITKSFVDQYIDKIYATFEDGKMKLDIKIFTGETISKYIENLRSRTGQMRFTI